MMKHIKNSAFSIRPVVMIAVLLIVLAHDQIAQADPPVVSATDAATSMSGGDEVSGGASNGNGTSNPVTAGNQVAGSGSNNATGGGGSITITCGAKMTAAQCKDFQKSSGGGGQGTVDGCETVSSGPVPESSCQAAKSTCNMISPQAQAMIAQALNTAKSAMSGMAATDPVALDKSAASSCKVGAAMSAIAGAGTLALAVMCETKVAACKKNNKPVTYATGAVLTSKQEEDQAALQKNSATCGALDVNLVMDGAAVLNYLMSYEQNSQCASFYTAAAAAAVPKTCAEEPTRPDCVCVINPNEPSCLGQTAGLSASTGFSDSSLRGNGNSSSADDALNVGPDAVGGTGGKNASLPGAPGGGGGGGPSLLGGKASPEGQDGAAPGPYNTNVISGTTSGGGGNPYAHGGSDGDGGHNSSLLSALANKFNLKKYLPGGAAAMRNPASDIYHSSSTDIFQVISVRYQHHGEMTP